MSEQCRQDFTTDLKTLEKHIKGKKVLVPWRVSNNITRYITISKVEALYWLKYFGAKRITYTMYKETNLLFIDKAE